MRIAILTRDARGEFGLLARALAGVLVRNNHEVVLELASEWIPAKYGGEVDRQVTMRVGCFAGFDHVFALGYRVALGCGQAFADGKTPWSSVVLSELPPDPPELARLMSSVRQIYSPTAVIKEGLRRKGLRQAFTLAPPTLRSELSSTEARQLLGLEPDIPLAVSFGQTPSDEDRKALEYRLPEAQWLEADVLAPHDPLHIISAADLVILGPKVGDFSYVGLCALAAGVPLLAPHGHCADALIEPRMTGQTYGPNDSVGDLVAGLLQLDLLRESMRGSARLKVESEYDPDDFLRHFDANFPAN